MIIDFHTHIFPPEVRERREECVRRDPTFAEMYGDPKATIATAEDLLHSMEEAGVDVSVALGFAWRDHDLCARHNDYILESAANSGGRIVPFCTINPAAGAVAVKEVARCVKVGARGLGELRPESQGWDLADGEEGESLAAVAREHALVLLFHVTEPVGHDYPGKRGLPVDQFYRFASCYGDIAIVGAHLGGGLPFSAETPQLRRLFDRVYFDTAAAPYLYEPDVYGRVAALAGAERILMGSDFPLIAQDTQIAAVRRGGLDEEGQRLVLGANAERLLKLGRPR